MNLCKSGIIGARTKSLREKFSRNRSYSELSFKDSNTTSSLVSTPTESCSGSLAGASSQTSIVPQQSQSTGLARRHQAGSSRQQQQMLYADESYCSAFDLSRQPFEEPRFPWQRDVAIQCDLISTPRPSTVATPPVKKSKEPSTVKKKISTSSTSSAASTLINAAAATLRMTGFSDSHSNSTSTNNNNNNNSRFWKSSLLLPSFNVSGVPDNNNNSNNPDEDQGSLRRQKSSRWASATAVRRPVLKRAVSFDSRGGYARLVQSTSSPNSPPGPAQDKNRFPNVVDGLNYCSTSGFPGPKTTSEYERNKANNCNVVHKCSLDSSHSYSSSGGGGNSKFWSTSPASNSSTVHCATALLGASAAMTAAAPFSSTCSFTKDPGPSSSISVATTTNTTNTNTDNSLRRKLSSNEVSLKEIRRRQFLVSRKHTSSAPNSFENDNDGSGQSGSGSSGENELYNFNTVHRLLDISLSASSNSAAAGSNMADLGHPSSFNSGQQCGVVKPYLLELPMDMANGCHPNLPSPNIQSEIQEVNPVLRKLSVLSRAPHKALTSRLSDSGPRTDHNSPSHGKKYGSSASAGYGGSRHYLDYDDDIFYDDEDEILPDEPSFASLQQRRRRRALVPPKLITDGYESSNEGYDAHSTSHKQQHNSLAGASSDPQLDQIGIRPTDSIQAGSPRTSTNLDSLNVTDRATGAKIEHITPSVSILDIDNVPELGQHSTLSRTKPSTTSANTSTSSSASLGHSGFNPNQLNPPSTSRNRRRSSVVVIPPMQICPGDLLVYSKVLSQRSNMMDNLDNSFSTALVNESESRKSHKNTWNLLRLFDRSTSRNKAAADQLLCGLEELLASLQPSNSFVDESMLRYRGISWNEFLVQSEERRISNASSSFASATSSLITSASAAASATVGIGCSRFFQGARFSSLQSNALDLSISNNQVPCAAHACKKISLPCGGINRVTQQNLERLKTLRQSKTDSVTKPPTELPDHQFGLDPLESSDHRPSSGLQRADSNGTVSDVESINEAVESTSPSHKPDTQAGPNSLSSQYSQAAEELSGDQYEGDSFCCTCYQITKREQRRREALWELFQSDLYFLTDHLMVLKNVFMEPLKKIQVEGYAMFAEPEVLFGNLDELCLVTYAFCREFLNILLAQTATGELQVVPILVKLFQHSGRAAALTQAYHRYTINYINALNYLETLRRQVEFSEFEKWCNRDTRCKKLQLTDLLVAPVQHVMRVPLLLKEIESRTQETAEKSSMLAIIEEQQHSLRELDDKMRWLKNFERLLEIQRNIIWPTVLDMDPKVFVPEFMKTLLTKQPCERLIVSPRRQILLEGPLLLLDSGKPVEMYVFLFDDLLLIARRKKGLGKKQSTLTERWVSNCSGRNSSFSSVVSSAGAAVTSSVGGSGTGSISTTASASTVANTAANITGPNVAGNLPVGNGEPNAGPLPGGGCAGSSLFKYVVHKQPLSLDRFYIHEADTSVEGAANLKNCFVLVCLNRFQQVTTVHTFQAASDSAKKIWLSKMRDTIDRWKRTLQNSTFRSNQQAAAGEKCPISTSHRLNLSNFQGTSGHSHKHHKMAQPPPPPSLSSSGVRASTSRSPVIPNDPISQQLPENSDSISMVSSLRDNASCSFLLDESITTASTTFT